MIKSVFTILLCVHLLGDFYFQTQKMADKKQSQFFWTVCHCLIYGACSGLLFCFFLPGMKLRYILAFISAHAVIDIVKYAVCRFLRNRHQYTGLIESPCGRRNVFLIDQAVHLITILGISYGLRETDSTLLYRDGFGIFFDSFNMPEAIFLKWVAVLLLIHKPVNILIANVLSGYKSSDKQDPEGADRNAGRMIGTLERIIMVIFISIGQYSAVGLVLTAKSIARYDRISKDQVFAEYYLLGTLLSTICAVIVALMFL